MDLGYQKQGAMLRFNINTSDILADETEHEKLHRGDHDHKQRLAGPAGHRAGINPTDHRADPDEREMNGKQRTDVGRDPQWQYGKAYERIGSKSNHLSQSILGGA